MNGHDTGGLSGLALARKDAIFETARGALVRRRRRRAALRAGSAAGAAVLVLAGAAYLATLARGRAIPAPAPIVADRGGPAPALPAPAPAEAAHAVRIARIATDAAILARTRATADAPRLVRRIGDDELLAALEGTGERYGIIRTGARVAVVCQTCRGPDGGFNGWGTDRRDAAPPPPRIRG